MADFLVLPRPPELAKWRRLQQRNLSILGLLRRKEWPRCHRESSWQVRQSRLGQKEKEQNRQSKAPNCEGERVKVCRAAPWRERGRSKREHEEEKEDSTVKEGEFQGGYGRQARRASLGQVEGSAPINSRLIVMVRFPTSFGLVEMSVGFPKSPSYPGQFPRAKFFDLSCYS